MYLITTYNIYGTNHPYFPNTIGGYGKAKKSKSNCSESFKKNRILWI